MRSLHHALGVTALVLACLCAAACGATTTTGTKAPAATASPAHAAAAEYTALLGAFRAAKLTVYEPGTAVHQPFLSAAGSVIFVQGQRVEVYQYPDTASAARDSTHIDKDACLIHTASGQEMVSWQGQPHLYTKGRLLVIYVGDNYDIIDVLVAQFGQQFAGE
jgi:hypothetical protein